MKVRLLLLCALTFASAAWAPPAVAWRAPEPAADDDDDDAPAEPDAGGDDAPPSAAGLWAELAERSSGLPFSCASVRLYSRCQWFIVVLCSCCCIVAIVATLSWLVYGTLSADLNCLVLFSGMTCCSATC